MSEYHLDDWSIVINDSWDGFKAPEQIAKYLKGYRVEDNKVVRTSRIVSVNGNVVTTKSGHTYILGTPDKEYLAYCEEIGKPIRDMKNPIKVI